MPPRIESEKAKGKPETFDFLGFTHFCAKTRKNGRFIVGRKTQAKRMRAKLRGNSKLNCAADASIPCPRRVNGCARGAGVLQLP